MLTKLTLALITAAAFVYAVYLLARKRPLKIVSRRENDSGFLARARYLFLLATAIIAGTWSTRAATADAQPLSEATSFPEESQILPPHPLFTSLRAAWRMLNTFSNAGATPDLLLFSSEGGGIGRDAAITTFKAVTAKAVTNGLLSQKAADELVIVHTALASHFLYSSMRLTCYKMTWSGNVLQKTSTELMAQLELLREKKGNLSAETLVKATESIRKQMEILKQLHTYGVAWDAAMAVKDTEKLSTISRTLGTELDTAIKNDTITITPETIEATALILKLEGATAAAVPVTSEQPIAPSAPAPAETVAPQTPTQRKP